MVAQAVLFKVYRVGVYRKWLPKGHLLVFRIRGCLEDIGAVGGQCVNVGYLLGGCVEFLALFNAAQHVGSWPKLNIRPRHIPLDLAGLLFGRGRNLLLVV